jgi:hypothetical protein
VKTNISGYIAQTKNRIISLCVLADGNNRTDNEIVAVSILIDKSLRQMTVKNIILVYYYCCCTARNYYAVITKLTTKILLAVDWLYQNVWLLLNAYVYDRRSEYTFSNILDISIQHWSIYNNYDSFYNFFTFTFTITRRLRYAI